MRAGKNIRLFKANWMEQCTYVHPVVPALLWLPLAVYLIATGIADGALSLRASLVLVAAGGLIWTLSEYVLHRFVFHFKPTGPFQERIAFLIHGIHHEDPADERRLLMPPVAAAALASAFYALFMTLLGSVNVKPFFAGFMLGYLVYDYTHWAVHFLNLKSERFKRLKKNHMLHHFTTPDRRYGVSGFFWDKVFHTDT